MEIGDRVEIVKAWTPLAQYKDLIGKHGAVKAINMENLNAITVSIDGFTEVSFNLLELRIIH